MSCLLAVDLGLKTGIALYEKAQSGPAIGLRWYRSHNYGSSARLRRGAYNLIGELPGLEYIVLEGGGPLADIWRREAVRKNIKALHIGAEAWRRALLYPRQQRTGAEAKHNAGSLARRVIEWSGAPRPTSLRHDAAEAILAGLWGVLEVGWLEGIPWGSQGDRDP